MYQEEAQKLNSIPALYGKKLGTINNHSYPSLQAYFDNKSIERIENKKLSNNINQLRFGVIDVVIDTKLSVAYCISKKNVAQELKISNENIDAQELHCMLRKERQNTLVKLNTALNELQHKGKIDKVLNRYRVTF